MSSTNKTSLGLNMWEASDKPVRQDFVNDNAIIDEKITQLNSDFVLENAVKTRFGAAGNNTYVDVYNSDTTFYRLYLFGDSKKLSYQYYDGSNLSIIFENSDSVKEINDKIEHIETIHSLLKNNISFFGNFRILIYHFRIGGDADPTFGNGYFTAQITKLNGVYTAIITSSWTGDTWNIIFTDYDTTKFTKKLS